MYLLDTNICIALLNENPQAVTKFNRFFSQCYLSVIVVSELYKGVYCSQQVTKNLEILVQFTELLPHISWTNSSGFLRSAENTVSGNWIGTIAVLNHS